MIAQWRAISIGLMVIFLAGCGGTNPSATHETEQDTVPAAYVIGAGDQLLIDVRDHPDLSVALPVRPDGRISVPMVRDVQAAGRTPTGLSDALEAELSTLIRDPIVSVMVSEFVGTYADRIRVIGQAAQPQAIPYRNGMTVLDALIQVGGLTEFAAGNRAKLVRRDGDGSREIGVRLDDLVNDGNLEQNVALRPGDVLVIPESIF